MENNNEISQEDVNTIIATLPPVIREYLAKGEFTDISRRLISKYALHVDQGAILYKEIMLLLVGVDDPDEFIRVLKNDGHLEEKIIQNIVQDINDEIFIPLREAEEKAGKQAVSIPTSGRISLNAEQIINPQSTLASTPSLDVSLPSSDNKDVMLLKPEDKKMSTPLQTENSPTSAPRPKIKVTVPITSYGKDPYREPIDEEK